MAATASFPVSLFLLGIDFRQCLNALPSSRVEERSVRGRPLGRRSLGRSRRESLTSGAHLADCFHARFLGKTLRKFRQAEGCQLAGG